MNGCCPTYADSARHGPECYFYWPCGCPRKRKTPDAKAEKHTHRFTYEEK